VTVTASGGTGVLTASPGGEPLPFVQGDLVPGTFTFTVEDANGCSGSADAIITEPALLIATALETIDVLCGGQCNGAIQYLVEGGTIPYSYQLEPNGTTGAFSGIIGSLCVGEYDLLTIDLNDCVDTLSFTISEPPALFIDVLLDAPTCTGMTDGSAIILTGGGTGEVTTIFDPDDYEITENAPGNYSISSLGETQFVIDIFDENECTLQEVVNVIPDIITDMVITTYSSPETCWNQMDGTATVAVQNGFLPLSYEWNDPEAQTTPVATGLASNEVYSVTVTDDIGCNLTVQVEVDPTIGCFFIANALTPNGDGANDFWLIGGLEFFPEAKVQVFNRWGQVVFESTGYPSPWNGSFEGELLPVADYYFIIDYSKDFDPIMGTVTIKY
jgi:gliding motility-associated-like protein